jgi:Lipopolysaccharide kinase (Kdo/WaaP) family
MPFISLVCPQCAAPLPRAAYWRTVTCVYCGTTVTRGAEVVQAAGFHQAYGRVHQDHDVPSRVLRVGSHRYGVLAGLGGGVLSEVFLARRIHPFSGPVTLKLGRDPASSPSLRHEAEVLLQLQALGGAGSAYFSQRLPQLVISGSTPDGTGRDVHALVLRHPAGHWGSLADAARVLGSGLDPRHVVWMWRRVLEVLGYLHDNGWSHGDLGAEHLLVHPANHGVLIIGWSQAQKNGKAAPRDLMQLAWTMRSLLAGPALDSSGAPVLPASVPAPLATLLRAASEDTKWIAQHGAHDMLAQVAQAAREAFGPPRFLPLVLPGTHAVA